MIDRVVRIIATFDADHRTQSSSQITRRARLPRTTAYRLVADLVASGLLERNEDGGITVGMRLWELATRGSFALGLREVALPAMERVQAVVRQHTQLAVIDDGQVLFLERLSHSRAGANITRIAGRLPLHASSSGLVLLAAAPLAVVESVLAEPLPAWSPDTITDPRELRRKLAQVRRLGYAIAPGSIETVSTGIAVPLRDRGTVVAALGVVLPRDEGHERRAISALLAAARDIESTLGTPRSAFD